MCRLKCPTSITVFDVSPEDSGFEHYTEKYSSTGNSTPRCLSQKLKT
jgi:hypothetical protein